MSAVPCTTFLEVKYYEEWQDWHMSIESVRVDNTMTKDVKTTKPAQTFKSVASIMNQNNSGSVVITETENNLPCLC